MIRRIARKLVSLSKMTSSEYYSYLKKKGVNLGDNVRFFGADSIFVDTQNPFMITIGNNVRITRGTCILTHDYSWSVIAGKYGEIIGSIGEVIIGDNVFIGCNTIILKSTHIGNNVIIGAGSVIKGDIDSDSVYAGNPCKRIMSIDEFYKKRKTKMPQEFDIIRAYYDENTTSKDTVSTYPIEYFPQYIEKGNQLTKDYLDLINRTGYKEMVLKNWFKKND